MITDSCFLSYFFFLVQGIFIRFALGSQRVKARIFKIA